MASGGYVVQKLSFGYESVLIFDELDAAVRSGAVTAVVGGNGAGKSTFLSLLAGLLAPTSGTIRPVPQRPSLLAQRTEHIDGLPLTVRDCVKIGLFGQVPLWRPFGRDARHAVDEVIERVGMSAFRQTPLRDLSGGQRQRALIAQALVQPADLYLLDEPSAALDFATKETVKSLLRERADAGHAVLIASHDPDEIRFADAVIDLGHRGSKHSSTGEPGIALTATQGVQNGCGQ